MVSAAELAPPGRLGDNEDGRSSFVLIDFSTGRAEAMRAASLLPLGGGLLYNGSAAPRDDVGSQQRLLYEVQCQSDAPGSHLSPKSRRKPRHRSRPTLQGENEEGAGGL